MYKNRKVAVVIPVYNEESSIGWVLADIANLYDPGSASRLVDEIIVCDNASTDNTAKIASGFNCKVVYEGRKGYGSACLAALKEVTSKDIVVFVDGDHSVVIEQMPKLVDLITRGADVVIGSRTMGRCERGALSFPQRFGNRIATKMIQGLWGFPATDLGPFRAITWKSLNRLSMQDTKFGWTVEMQVKAIQEKLIMIEVAVDTRKRIGVSKISGTLNGVVNAGKGIIGTILKLWWSENSFYTQFIAPASSQK